MILEYRNILHISHMVSLFKHEDISYMEKTQLASNMYQMLLYVRENELKYLHAYTPFEISANEELYRLDQLLKSEFTEVLSMYRLIYHALKNHEESSLYGYKNFSEWIDDATAQLSMVGTIVLELPQSQLARFLHIS